MISPDALGPNATVCFRCDHPYAWHRPLDTLDLDPLDPSATESRCYGHDPAEGGLRRGCLKDCMEHDVSWVSPLVPRDATTAEHAIAELWVDRHHWTNPLDAEVEYAHALAVLVFANARPPRLAPRGIR